MTEHLLAWGRVWMVSLYEVSWQVAVLVVLVSVACAFLRKSAPAVRHGLWCIVLLRLCIPVELNLPGRAALEPKRPEWVGKKNWSPAERDQARAAWRERRARIQRTRQGLTAAGIGWGVTVLALTACVGGRAWALRRRLRRLPEAADPGLGELLAECRAELGLRRRVQIRCAPDHECPVPAVTAFYAPVIILPETMIRSWEKKDLKPILMHELAHVRRWDVLINWIQIVLQCIYFFHPLVWLANWKIRTLREEACDDMSVVHLGGRPAGYSRSLLRAVELAGAAVRPVCGTVALHERRSDLGKRLRRLLTDGYRPSCESRLAAGCKIAVIGLLCVALSGLLPAKGLFGAAGYLDRAAGQCHAWKKRGECDGKFRGSSRHGQRGGKCSKDSKENSRRKACRQG